MNILIIGGGTAGISASIFLAKSGINATIIDRHSLLDHPPSFKVGESLPPIAHKLLVELGIWDDFQQQDHQKCYGNQSVWGSNSIDYRDFIHHPIGYGWHLDRIAFERLLLQTAQKLGVYVYDNSSIQTAHYTQQKWRVNFTCEDAPLKEEFDFVIDASGRGSWFARQQGVERLYEDIQLALIAFLKLQDTETHHATLIETTPDGWWYSAYLPNNLLATNFLCSPDPVERKAWMKQEGWQNLMQKTHHTHHRISQHHYDFSLNPQFVAADTSILEQTYGEGWIAIGDAAMTYDPVSSHGMLMAMTSARDAAEAIVHYRNGKQDTFIAYNAVMWAAFEKYRVQRKALYRTERRFESKYWEERQY